MIKKTFLSLFVGFVGLIGFSNAWTYKGLNTIVEDSSYPGYQISVVNRGGFLTQILGGGFHMIYLKNTSGTYQRNMFLYWDTEGYLYSFKSTNGGYISQGRVKKFSYCDYFDSSHGNSSPSNCSLLSYDKDLVGNFLSTVSSSDSFMYYVNTDRLNSSLALCVSSLELNKSICFCGGNRDTFGSQSCSLDTSFSKNYVASININEIPSSDIGISPGAGGGGNNGGGGSLGNNNYLCPTIGQVLSTYGSNYNTGLCYSSSLIMQGGSVVSTTPQSIFDLFPNQSDFINYRQLYANYCSNSVSVGTDCQNAFAGKDIEYTLIAKIPGSIPSLNLYNYCNLALNYDPNTSTCVASGVSNPNVSREDVLETIIKGNYNVVVPETGTIIDDVLLSGNSGLSYNGDILDSIYSIFSKITSLFSGHSGVVGIIPSYIIFALLGVILFRLFKK